VERFETVRREALAPQKIKSESLFFNFKNLSDIFMVLIVGILHKKIDGVKFRAHHEG
jgi:hypothetical protein